MHRTPRSGIAYFAAAIALTIVAMVPAAAHRQTRSDPNDVSGPLDIKSASFRHRHVTLTTRGDWTKATLRSGKWNDNLFEFDFDSKGGPAVDGAIVIDAKREAGHVFLAEDFYTYANGEWTLEGGCGAICVSRDGRTVKAVTGYPGPRDSYIRWSANSRYTHAGACSGTCVDSIPDDGWIRHNL